MYEKKIFNGTSRGKILRAIKLCSAPVFKLLKLSLQPLELIDYFLWITKENLDHREKTNVQRNNFINLLQSIKNTDEPLDLKNMKDLDMGFQGTLRKYRHISMVERTSIRPYQISETNMDLPSVAECIIPICALHHSPDYHPDQKKFDPERFIDETKSQRPPFVFLPFGGGPRACIGGA